MRQDAAYRHLHDALSGTAPMVRVKSRPPYSDASQSKVYLNPLSRATCDAKTGEWTISGEAIAPPNPLMSESATAAEHEQLAKALAGLQQQQQSTPGVGVDIELVSSINIDNETFIERNFTAREIAYCRSAPDPRASFTGRWCAKEAAIKAVSSFAATAAATEMAEFKPQAVWTGGAGGPLADIEIVPASTGAPTVIFHGPARDAVKRAGVRHVTLSISHSGSYAMAMASASL